MISCSSDFRHEEFRQYNLFAHVHYFQRRGIADAMGGLETTTNSQAVILFIICMGKLD